MHQPLQSMGSVAGAQELRVRKPLQKFPCILMCLVAIIPSPAFTVYSANPAPSLHFT